MASLALKTIDALPEGESRIQQQIDALPSELCTEQKEQFERIVHTAVIGSGAMGRCIAIALLRLGKEVRLIDSQPESLKAARKFIEQFLQKQLLTDKLTADQVRSLNQAITYQLDWAGLGRAELVIEAVPEVLTLKQDIMRRLSEAVPESCILATNTSTLDLDAIAEAAVGSERVVGTHFFIPAHVTQLLELVPAKQTSVDTLNFVKAMALEMRKVFVVAGNCDGFIGNRLFDRFHQEAMYLIEEGATPEQVDRVLEHWGMAIGPLRALDMVGNDIPWPVRRARQERNPDLIQPRIGDALCEEGGFGQKSGRGWYRYEAESRKPQHSDETDLLMRSVSKELGLTRRRVSDDEVLERVLLALINEGAAVVREGFAQSQAAIDLAYVMGYGFPRAKGGPMALKDHLGAKTVCQRIAHYAGIAQYGERLWRADPALLEEAQ